MFNEIVTGNALEIVIFFMEYGPHRPGHQIQIQFGSISPYNFIKHKPLISEEYT